MKRIILILLTIALSTALATPASAGDDQQGGAATEAVRKRIDNVVTILKDAQYADAEPEKLAEQRQKILAELDGFFDFERIAQLSLGRFRRQFNKDELKTFTGLFTDLLTNTYLKQVQAEFENEKVDYMEEVHHPSDKERVMVKTLVYRRGNKVPVDYSMYLHNGKWQVYDVKVGGVSLVKNYRTQFEKILLNESPQALIEKIREKVEKMDDGDLLENAENG
jgi:phospholipid transport system substrate-binding protein